MSEYYRIPLHLPPICFTPAIFSVLIFVFTHDFPSIIMFIRYLFVHWNAAI